MYRHVPCEQCNYSGSAVDYVWLYSVLLGVSRLVCARVRALFQERTGHPLLPSNKQKYTQFFSGGGDNEYTDPPIFIGPAQVTVYIVDTLIPGIHIIRSILVYKGA